MNSNRTDSARCLYEQNSIPIAAYTATTTGTAVSIAGCGPSVDIVVRTGTLTLADATNFMTITVLQGTTNAAADTPDATQYDKTNSWDGIINDASDANKTFRINFIVKPDYDWLKIVATETAASSFNGTLGAWVEFEPSVQPVLAT